MSLFAFSSSGKRRRQGFGEDVEGGREPQAGPALVSAVTHTAWVPDMWEWCGLCHAG